MASVCRVMLETPEYRSRFTNEETVSFCLRVMVGVIILYDHVHPVGAFAKTSKIDAVWRLEGALPIGAFLYKTRQYTICNMPSIFERTTKKLVKEIGDRELRPVKCLVSAAKIRFSQSGTCFWEENTTSGVALLCSLDFV
ncbi:Protein FAM49B [Myotis brandtii]|uniref:Protein FAM49B n=1 Tax=Myotis brandtii TaxID=109478 RepID=S7NP44_MYOBR|nr:Protein FAM49B [Myotis brandtii]